MAASPETVTRETPKLEPESACVDAATEQPFVYSPPDFWEGSRLPRWLQAFVMNVFVLVVSHYNLWLLPTLGVAYYLVLNGGAWLVAVLVVAYLPSFLDGTQSTAHGRQWNAFRSSNVWNLVASNYLKIKVIRESPLDCTKKYIFGYHPHGILVLSRFAISGGNWEKVFPGLDFRFLGASAMFSVPLAREACLWLGGVDASRSTAQKVLSSGKSITVYPGGVPEIFLVDPLSKDNVIVLKKRLGFIKLALRNGADLVPVFVFGEKWLYRVYSPPQWFTSFVWKTVRVPFIFFWGRFLWMPLPATEKPFGVVYGKPIAVNLTENPTDEEVLALHKRYTQEVERLFAQYKSAFGYDEDERLVIS